METTDIVAETGRRISKLRRKLNISQEELSNRASISKNYLGEIERGQRSGVSIKTIAEIAKSLDLSLTDLFLDIEYAAYEEDITEGEETANNIIYNKLVEEACYPPKMGRFKVTTLMQFMLYLPLIDFRDLIDISCRIQGAILGDEYYILEKIDACVKKIPPSPAKEYADSHIGNLTKIGYQQRESIKVAEFDTLFNQNCNELREGHTDYLNIIKRSSEFFYAYDVFKDKRI